MSSSDPLSLAELEPKAIDTAIAQRNSKARVPNEVELAKEARLAEKEKRLAASSSKSVGKPPETPAPVPLPPPNKTPLLDKITAYRERFPNLKKRNNVTAKSTFEEIEDELHYLELQLGSQPGGANLSTTIFYGGMLAIEKSTDYWNPLGLNLTGLGTVTQQNMADFQPILDELMIKHNAGMYTSPEWRLALAIGATVMTVNAANNNPEVARAVKQMHTQVKKPAAADL